MHRIPSLEKLGALHGYSYVTTENLCRVTNDAEDGAGTRMGKGSRAHVSKLWAASMLFTLAVKDPKNAAVLVSAFARMRLDKASPRLVIQTVTLANRLTGPAVPNRVGTMDFPSNVEWEDNVFLALADKVELLAFAPPDAPLRRRLLDGYRIDIHLSPIFRVMVVQPFAQNEPNVYSYTTAAYELTEADAKQLNSFSPAPSPRMVSITAEQIDAAVMIYADTMAFELSGQPGLPSHLKPTSSEADDRLQSRENDNAGDRCDTVPACVQPNQSPTDGFRGRQQDAPEKEKFQGNRLGSAGRSLFTSHGAHHDRHQHQRCAAGAD